MAKWWRGLRSMVEEADLSASSFVRSLRCLHQDETIQAIPREATGRRVSARDRTIGRIPAVLQTRAGQGSSSLVESGQVLPLKIHRDEESGKILKFSIRNDGEQLKVDVPLVFKWLDNCPGIKKAGGSLRSMRSSLKLIGPVEHMPSKIEVEVSKLDIGDRVLMQEVVFHPSLKLLSKNETLPVCKIAATSPVKEPEAVLSI
ncbi:unnamed protein product [Brassica rapa subsp. narinosa]